MKDKNLISLILRAFKLEYIDEEYATESILERYTNSKRFNWNSFQWGVIVGGIIGLIIMYFVKWF